MPIAKAASRRSLQDTSAPWSYRTKEQTKKELWSKPGRKAMMQNKASSIGRRQGPRKGAGSLREQVGGRERGWSKTNSVGFV